MLDIYEHATENNKQNIAA